MDAAEWLAEFDQRGREYQAERAAYHGRVAAMIAAERVGVVPMPVVLEPGHDVDDEMVSVPASARRVASAGRGAGWSTRMVASLAAEPKKGLAAVVTVRLRRHDERAWAAWSNGGFDVAWYVGPTGLERLGWARLPRTKRRGVLDVVEGIRGPAQWVDLLAHQELARAIQVLDTSLGLR